MATARRRVTPAKPPLLTPRLAFVTGAFATVGLVVGAFLVYLLWAVNE